MNNDKIIILDGARTPIGSFGGIFKDVPGFELGATAAKEALARAGVSADDIREVVMGCIGQVGPDAYNARRVAITAGLPANVPAYTVNRLCGSGLQAIWSAAMEMRWNDLDFALAGGDESMTRMPFYDFGARSGYKLGNRELVDGTVMMLTDPFHGIHMGVTAENVADKYDVSRAEQDEFAAESQRRAATPEAQAAFAEEIVAVEVGGRKPFTVEVDEHPKPGTTVEVLAGLRPAFAKDGTVTAGNASGINDGAAAVVLARESAAGERGLTGLVTLETVTTAAMEPELMGYAPTLALRSLFEQTGTSPSDIGIIELNEAFASQAVAVMRDVELDPAQVNPYGGAIALGHPVGATGANLTLRVAKDMVRRDLELGIVTMCIGGGQALAALFKRV
ncbi:thiolase family protein [Nocardioides seonyuensis]|uniref:Probable acetyl-CoA acetyltransferase n=1 Tax=Nocardioides seonyuensis TaxID=2518371 RepID=A0A4P7IFK9_9ACTN|nr:thiolase family protein [Nocardioides seonyuensis]QBX55968.1 thiolase family protein [Nocardioides seonyuensis]